MNKTYDASSIDHLDFVLSTVNSSADYDNSRNRLYNGQPHTSQGERGKQIIEGLTMRDLVDCFVMGVLESSGDQELNDKVRDGKWRYSDVWDDRCNDVDIMAVSQNMCCNIEKMMGIYPNLPEDTPSAEELIKHWQ